MVPWSTGRVSSSSGEPGWSAVAVHTEVTAAVTAYCPDVAKQPRCGCPLTGIIISPALDGDMPWLASEVEVKRPEPKKELADPDSELAGLDPWLLRQVARVVESPQSSEKKKECTLFSDGPAGGANEKVGRPMPELLDPRGGMGHAVRRQTFGRAEAFSSVEAMELVKALGSKGPRLSHILDKICNAARMDANNAALLTELGAVHAVLSQLKSHRHDFLIHSKMAYALDILFNWIMREVPEEEALSNSLHRLFREATSF